MSPIEHSNHRRTGIMKTNLTNWLAALCAILLIILLMLQTKQKNELDTLQQEHQVFVSATEQRQQESREAVTKLAGQVTNLDAGIESRFVKNEQRTSDEIAKLSDQVLSLGTNWEAELTPRLKAKSDEVITAFAIRLDAKAAEASAQVANVIRIQAEAVLNSSLIERSNKTFRLLEAATRYEKANRPELVELCYLSALRTSDDNPRLVLKPLLAWKERSFESLSDSDWLTKAPATLMSLYQTLDQALPGSSASAEEMEAALAATDRIQGSIVVHQQAKLEALRAKLSWATFDATNLPTYEISRDILTTFAPANASLETSRNELQSVAETLIQTANAMNSFSTTAILPPSPKAPAPIITNWLETGLAFVSNPANRLEARLNAVNVLLDFAQNQAGIPDCQRYAQIFTNESVRLACVQWADRVDKYGILTDQKDKPDAESLTLGQALLNQGLALVKTFPDKTVTTAAIAVLPGLASKLYSQRELMLVKQMRLAETTKAFPSKEQAARARSLLYGQMLSAIFDAKALKAEIAILCNPPVESFAILDDIQKRFAEYLSAYDKFDKADIEDAKAEQLVKLRQQYQRYADYCRNKKDSAYRHYRNADEERGLTTGRFYAPYYVSWNDEYQQDQLKKGLSDLYSIDVNDLNRADPGLATEWATVEDTLKKHYGGSASHVNELTKKKSLADF